MARKPTYIRAWREKRGHTLDDMVGRLDALGVKITGASLSRIERGIQPYNQDTLEAIAEALNVTVGQLPSTIRTFRRARERLYQTPGRPRTGAGRRRAPRHVQQASLILPM
jgi:transcriptional regulator with XRE-family HTH domain